MDKSLCLFFARARFHCPDCLMDGAFDVITASGIVKECKTGKPKLQKIASASSVIFSGAPVHLAIPKGMQIDVQFFQYCHCFVKGG